MAGFRCHQGVLILFLSKAQKSSSFLSVTGQLTHPLLGNMTLQTSRSLSQQCRFLFQLGRPWRTILILARLGQRPAVHPSTLTRLGRSIPEPKYQRPMILLVHSGRRQSSVKLFIFLHLCLHMICLLRVLLAICRRDYWILPPLHSH